MASMNNPAGRLHILLSQGKSVPENTQAGHAWAKLLDTSQDDIPLLLRRIGGVVELPAITKEEVLAQKGINHDTYLKWLPQVEKAMSQLNFQGPWKTFMQFIDGTTLYGLEVCDDLLSRAQPTAMPDESTLTELHEQIRDVTEDVVNAELGADIRAFLLHHLREVDTALVDYRVSGIVPVERAIHAVLGDAVLKRDLGRRTQQTPLGERFWKVMARIAVVLTTLNSAYQLTGSVLTLLLNAPEQVDSATPGGRETIPEVKPIEQNDNPGLEV